ncbi:glycosyltransferase family 9 protein [Phenylobacterium sp.]|uniref:glycosyltransferase family 9 protein n=1 Tax=Phenylobacterium sp. TaxID=1871053 RepID=UPI003426067B
MAAYPADPRPRYGLALLLLARGSYNEGWRLYEARADIPETRIHKPRLSFPEWNGAEVQSLLLWPEQGLGDQIMYARFVPKLLARGYSVTMLAPPPLVRVLRPLGCNIISAEGEVGIPRHEAWCLVGSLPHLVGEIPTAPYLTGSEKGTGVGVMAAGNPQHVNDAARSLPPNLRGELLRMGRDLSPASTGAADFEETAEIIRGLETVISVDTAVAHLAGAMGKPTWLLLPYQAEWRWGRGHSVTNLYPSMRLFRQETPGDWRQPLRDVREALLAR